MGTPLLAMKLYREGFHLWLQTPLDHPMVLPLPTTADGLSGLWASVIHDDSPFPEHTLSITQSEQVVTIHKQTGRAPTVSAWGTLSQNGDFAQLTIQRVQADLTGLLVAFVMLVIIFVLMAWRLDQLPGVLLLIPLVMPFAALYSYVQIRYHQTLLLDLLRERLGL